MPRSRVVCEHCDGTPCRDGLDQLPRRSSCSRVELEIPMRRRSKGEDPALDSAHRLMMTWEALIGTATRSDKLLPDGPRLMAIRRTLPRSAWRWPRGPAAGRSRSLGPGCTPAQGAD